MQDKGNEILVWLPWPMGDAILCTPALRAIRKHFESSKIWFLSNPVVRQTLSPCQFNDGWIEESGNNPFFVASKLRERHFSQAILFKNSFFSALVTYLAHIPRRIGYARDGRGFLLTDKLYPPKLDGKFKPISMVDYYLTIAAQVNAVVNDRSLELRVEPKDNQSLNAKIPELTKQAGPIVILVPGGAYGPSKRWPADRFSQTAEWLVAKYDATVIVSVAHNEQERLVAARISKLCRCKVINLAQRPLSIGELKALFSIADLVVTNDTGPRHIAIALGRNVVSLFGPNNPVWTDTGYANEIQIIGNVPCAPCGESICKMSTHLCMQAITVEMVCKSAQELLEKKAHRRIISAQGEFLEIGRSFFVRSGFETTLNKLALTSMDSVFSFNSGRNLTKRNLAQWRNRTQIDVNLPRTTLFLKRYDRPPVAAQIKSWLWHQRRQSLGSLEHCVAAELAASGIKTPKTVSYGEDWGAVFEKRSFIMTEKIASAQSLEQTLPEYFEGCATEQDIHLRRQFISRLAIFVRQFHQTDYRHRDLYLSHIFWDHNGNFYLIDLARAFKPRLCGRRFLIKDLAQLHYSSPAKHFSRMDRIRFYHTYAGRNKLTMEDKTLIKCVLRKAWRMARHDIKQGKNVPFLSGA